MKRLRGAVALASRCLAVASLGALLLSQAGPAHAATTLSVTPITWNVIGLDSNDVDAGPNHFPVGVRVCNTGAEVATPVQASLVWDSVNPYLDLRTGSASSLSVSSLGIAACTDFYFEVEVDRDPAAYDTRRRYHIHVTADGGATTADSPTPREIYVEHLVSQSRNYVIDVQVGESETGLTSVAPGGSMTLLVGGTYYIKLVASTATNGYEQIESFINFPNTIFQVLEVDTTYTADTSPRVSSPDDKLYGDGCLWENDPYDLNYRSCLETGKAGGNIEVLYKVQIISTPGPGLSNPEPLSTLIYDFSGSSFHYNAGYGVTPRYGYILDPDTIPITKAFVPDAIAPGATSRLVIRITNPTPNAMTGVNFVDPLPGTAPNNVKVAAAPNASTNGCGSPTFSPAANDTTLYFSYGTIAPNSACIINVDVTAPAGTYLNTTNNLFIDGTSPGTGIDTHHGASATLTAAADVVACSNQTMAQWSVPSTATNPPDTSTPVAGSPTTRAANVSTATASAADAANSTINTAGQGGAGTGSWETSNYKAAPDQSLTFRLQTKNYSGVGLAFYDQQSSPANGPQTNTRVLYSTDGSSFTEATNFTRPLLAWAQHTADLTGVTSTTSDTWIRILPSNDAKNDSASILVDLITFTGCSYIPPPTLNKYFGADTGKPDTIGVGSSYNLTFTVANPGSTQYDAAALTGVTFTDTLPDGLRIADPNGLSATCDDAPYSGTITATANTSLVRLIGANLAAGASCTISLNVTGTAAGSYENVTSYVDSAESEPNKTSSGYGYDTITVVAPPAVSKTFGTASILTGQTTSLTFTVNNPDPVTTLTSVAFSDTLPSGLVLATPSGLSATCDDAPYGGTVTAADGASLVSLSGATLAVGASCTITVDVLGQTAGTKDNTTGNVTGTGAGLSLTGNTASASLEVQAPTPGISLSKMVGPSSTGPWNSFLNIAAGQPVYYQLTIENTGDVALDPVTVTDPDVSTSGCSWRTPLPVADASDDDHIDTCIVGPVTAVTGYHPNTATATGTGGGITASDEDTASYSTTGLTLVKRALDAEFSAGCPGGCDTISYEYGVTNTGAVDLAAPVTVADDKATVSCPPLGDGYLNVGETTVCTATYSVTGTDETNGYVTNVATATADGVTSNDDTQTVPRIGVIDFAVTKNDGTTTLVAGGTTTYTVTVENNGPDVDSATIQDSVVAGLTKTAIGPCYAFGGATCPVAGGGAGELNVTNLENGTVVVPSMPNGSSISFTVTASVSGAISTGTTSLTNTFLVAPATKQDIESSNSTASDTDGFAQNFGHLPASFPNTQGADNGAYHLTGATCLGASVPTEDDGIDATTFAAETDDNGVAWTPSTTWVPGTDGGSLDVTPTCPGAPCYLYGWFDWDGSGTFDAGEQILAETINIGGKRTITFDIPAGHSLTGVFYARFRLYAEPPDTASPGGQAVTTGKQTIGEVEDYQFVMSGGVMTPVTLAHFLAEPLGQGVRLRWSTATETGNVGFHVYAHEGGRAIRLNEELVASHVVDSLDRQDYVFEAETAGRTFSVEDVSVLGEVRRHGPFDLGREYGSLAKPEKVDWASVHRELKSAAAARARRHGLRQPTTLGLEVRQTGIHRLGYEELLAAGLDLARVPLRRVALTNLGQAVPFHASGVGHLGPGQYLEFHGQAFDSVYTDANVYALRVDGTEPRPMAFDGSLPAAVPPATSYDETLRVERQRAYANYAPGQDAWYDAAMLAYTTPKTWSFPFQVDALADPSAEATLELVLWGVTNWPQDPDHHVVVKVNGVAVADESFEGLVEHVVRVTLPGHTLREGPNTLELTLPGDTGAGWDLVNLDRFGVTYRRELRARDGRLTFVSAEPVLRVANLNQGDVTVYRLAAEGPVRLSPIVEALSDGTYAATFAGDPAGNFATYAVAVAKAMLAPEVLPARDVADLEKPAQYLIVSHPAFIEELQPLVQAREGQGLTVSVVDVTDLYDRYTYGILDPLAIRRYLAHAVQDLGTEYVLLVGGDTYDYRNYLGLNSVSFVPSLYASTGPLVRFVPVDPLYGDVDGDNLPDVAVGRFPVRTSAELRLMVDKTLAYEGKDYGRTSAFVADVVDGALSFKNISTRLAAAMPPGWSVERLNLDDAGVAAAKASLLSAMNRGTALVTFTGHSGPVQWTNLKLFGTADAAALTNAGRPFVVVQWGCWNTYHVDPSNKYLVQGFLFSGDRGAAAVLGASTLTSAASEAALGERLTPRLAAPGVPVGKALLEAKRDLAETNPGQLDVLLGWTLMGDPALVVEP